MLESVTIENYLSFKEEQTISFIASREKNRKPNSPDWIVEIGDTKLLKVLLFFGNNGSGKTNTFSAISYLRRIVTQKFDNRTTQLPYRPFLLNDYSKNEPTKLSITYYLEEIKYSYSIKLNQSFIEEEELKRYLGRNTARIYYRCYDGEKELTDITFGTACDIPKTEQKLIIANTISNTSVLSVFWSMNLESEELKKNFLFFDKGLLALSEPNTNLAEMIHNLQGNKKEEVKRLILQLLSDIGSNITDYEIKEFPTTIPQELLEKIKTTFPEALKDYEKEKHIIFKHQTTHGEYFLEDTAQSNGTINIIKLLILIYSIIIRQKTLFIDEVERGIHSKALSYMIRLFLTLSTKSQLVLATQDLTLLDDKDLRRDSIRIVNKNKDGISYINGVNQHRMHRNLNIYNYYYSGKLDSVPITKDKEDIIHEIYKFLIERNT